MVPQVAASAGGAEVNELFRRGEKGEAGKGRRRTNKVEQEQHCNCSGCDRSGEAVLVQRSFVERSRDEVDDSEADRPAHQALPTTDAVDDLRGNDGSCVAVISVRVWRCRKELGGERTNNTNGVEAAGETSLLDARVAGLRKERRRVRGDGSNTGLHSRTSAPACEEEGRGRDEPRKP